MSDVSCLWSSARCVVTPPPACTVQSLVLDRFFMTCGLLSSTRDKVGVQIPKTTKFDLWRKRNFPLIWNHTFYLFLYRGFQNAKSDVSGEKTMTSPTAGADDTETKTQSSMVAQTVQTGLQLFSSGRVQTNNVNSSSWIQRCCNQSNKRGETKWGLHQQQSSGLWTAERNTSVTKTHNLIWLYIFKGFKV